MTTNVDVFVGNDTLIDPDIYQLWLNGHSGRLLIQTCRVVDINQTTIDSRAVVKSSSL